ncbi:hypothetical protein ACEVJK_00890 [Flintibacter sp. P01028]|uniref:hypothetical protein n=1 Tax=Flintibacter sp. P01028 TaxID=3342382 RepID=UPI0035B5C58B
MTKNELRKIKKGIQLIDLLINRLSESKSFDPIFEVRNTFYHIFYDGNKLDDLFVFLFPIEQIENISRIFRAIQTAAGTGPDFISGPSGGINITVPDLISNLNTINHYLKQAITQNSFKIFYSWQSDLPNTTNRGFIESALEKAILNINKETNIPLAIDKDTSNKAGSPDIAHTIFEKIDDCFLFIADISLITVGSDSCKMSPNPNVLIELGYAQGVLNEENIIMIFNSAFGKIEDLPFDLRGKRIMQYSCPKDAELDRKKGYKEALIKQLQRAIQLSCRYELR